MYVTRISWYYPQFHVTGRPWNVLPTDTAALLYEKFTDGRSRVLWNIGIEVTSLRASEPTKNLRVAVFAEVFSQNAFVFKY
jgi:hypothetical protein